MKTHQARGKIYHGWRRVAYSIPVIFLTSLFMIMAGRATWRVYSRWSEARQALSQVRERNQEEITRKENLKESVAKLKTERGWEEEVRNNFQVAKPGEGVIIIVE
ncbi:MAG: septum formation initiator family protein [Patescibacteria group bacterium]